MTIAIEEITLRRLSLAKLLYQQAAVQVSAIHGDVIDILAVVIFDLAAETALKAIVSAIDASKTPARDFQGVIQQADELLANRGLGSVPDKPNLQHVHALRNDAQHKAKYPDNSQVQDCRTYVRDFLDKLLNDVWGLSLESLSLTDLIKDLRVKAYLIAAENALASGKYIEALIKSEAGLSTTLEMIRASVVGQMDSFANPNLTYVPWDKSQPSTYSLIETLRDHIVRTTVGLNFADYSRYRRIVDFVIDSIQFMEDGDYDVNLTGEQATHRQAEFVVSYAVNAVIQIEGVVGNLDDPFASVPFK